MTLTLTSQAFRQNGEIPPQHTCQGADVSPPLAWSGVPANTKSLALIVDDPDAPDPAATGTRGSSHCAICQSPRIQRCLRLTSPP